MDWIDIESAPKDGRVIRLKGRYHRDPPDEHNRIAEGHYDTGGFTEGWETEGGAWFDPVAWMPMQGDEE